MAITSKKEKEQIVRAHDMSVRLTQKLADELSKNPDLTLDKMVWALSMYMANAIDAVVYSCHPGLNKEEVVKMFLQSIVDQIQVIDKDHVKERLMNDLEGSRIVLDEMRKEIKDRLDKKEKGEKVPKA